jgi:cell division protease FtsH
LGKEFGEQRNYSEKVAERIDEEVDMIIKDAQKNAEQILLKHRALLRQSGQKFDRKEIIEREEYEKIVKSK